MDELEISGKRYISTRRAAKEHKYHSDYIGQLIRGGKVEGQKVGRSWYVVADSLTEYLGNEASVKTAPRTAVPVKQVVREIEEESVEEMSEPIEIKEELAEEVEQVVEEPLVAEEIVEKEIEDAEEHHIPLKIQRPVEVKKEIPAVKARPSLRYIADDGPLYPRAERTKPQIKMRIERPEPVKEETVYVEQEPVVIIERPQRAKKTIGAVLMRGGVVVALGVITLAVVAGASAFVVSTTTVQGESANVSYSLGGI